MQLILLSTGNTTIEDAGDRQASETEGGQASK
jgi:hypothetical protein